MDYQEYRRNLSVSVLSIELDRATAAGIAPLIDSLKEEFGFVGATHTNHPPPLAGSGPTILTLVEFVIQHWEWVAGGAGGVVLTGIGKYAGEFLSELGKLHAGRVDKHLAELATRKKPEDEGQARFYAPLVIKIERVRLVFDEATTEAEYTKQRQAAAEYVKTLPDSAFEPRHAPPDYDWYYWSNRDQSWGKYNDRQRASIKEGVRDRAPQETEATRNAREA